MIHAGFLSVSVIGTEKIPMSARKGLVDLQQKIKNNAAGDPRLTRAWQLLEPTLQDAGILGDKDRRQQFRGALSDALEDFQTERQEYPNTEETKLIGTQLMKQVKRLHWYSSSSQMFEAPVPNELIDSTKEKRLRKMASLFRLTNRFVESMYAAPELSEALW